MRTRTCCLCGKEDILMYAQKCPRCGADDLVLCDEPEGGPLPAYAGASLRASDPHLSLPTPLKSQPRVSPPRVRGGVDAYAAAAAYGGGGGGGGHHHRDHHDLPNRSPPRSTRHPPQPSGRYAPLDAQPHHAPPSLPLDGPHAFYFPEQRAAPVADGGRGGGGGGGYTAFPGIAGSMDGRRTSPPRSRQQQDLMGGGCPSSVGLNTTAVVCGELKHVSPDRTHGEREGRRGGAGVSSVGGRTWGAQQGRAGYHAEPRSMSPPRPLHAQGPAAASGPFLVANSRTKAQREQNSSVSRLLVYDHSQGRPVALRHLAAQPQQHPQSPPGGVPVLF